MPLHAKANNACILSRGWGDLLSPATIHRVQVSMRPNTLDVGGRACRRIALRILPFVFLLYVIAYIDRTNVSFAALRMNADLGFSDRVFGLGIGMFYITYVLFEIPGAVIVERWSARKWIARIMITWGAVTILTAFVRTTGEFYVARLFLGAAEASFFPGMIVYLTHWFRHRERSRAIACLYAAVPAATLAGSPLAGWLLGVHWRGLAGWRWLFIAEGIPAIIFGVMALFYLTDRPAQARWLPSDECEWLESELTNEIEAKKRLRDFTILQAFSDSRVLFLILAWFLTLAGYLGNIYWLPTFLKRLSGFSNSTVSLLMLIPAVIGIAVTLLNGWHADKTREVKRHTAAPLLLAALTYTFLIVAQPAPIVTLFVLLVTTGVVYAYLPTFWAMPTMMLSGSAAAATFGLINSVGQLGGIAGPTIVGSLNDPTHTPRASFAFIVTCYIVASALILTLKIRHAVDTGETVTAEVP
jgi:MFS transporter, ACS family, tartrate transporter